MDKKGNLSVLLGAAFLMATSAIGPGFMTQTAVFTTQMGATFAFVIFSICINVICGTAKCMESFSSI